MHCTEYMSSTKVQTKSELCDAKFHLIPDDYQTIVQWQNQVKYTRYKVCHVHLHVRDIHMYTHAKSHGKVDHEILGNNFQMQPNFDPFNHLSHLQCNFMKGLYSIQ